MLCLPLNRERQQPRRRAVSSSPPSKRRSPQKKPRSPPPPAKKSPPKRSVSSPAPKKSSGGARGDRNFTNIGLVKSAVSVDSAVSAVSNFGTRTKVEKFNDKRESLRLAKLSKIEFVTNQVAYSVGKVFFGCIYES